MVKKVLVTGASGTVGYEVIQELTRRDRYVIRILCLDRTYERRLFSPQKDKIDIVWGDIRNIHDVQDSINGVDFVIHTAGIIPPLADQNPGLTYQVNMEGTRNLVEAMKCEDEPPKIIFTSSISVYGDRIENPLISVDDPINPSKGDVYARSKIAAEEIIQEAKVPWYIFRLCGILARNFKIQPLMFHMPLDTALEWCHPEDVGYALVEALEHQLLTGRIFNLGGGEKCRIKAGDFLDDMFDIWGLDADILPKYSFAIQNFHSGYYEDGHRLNNVLNFQKKTLLDYYEYISTKISPLQKFLVRSIPRNIIRRWLISMSEPLNAIKKNNEVLIERFYGSRKKFNDLVANA